MFKKQKKLIFFSAVLIFIILVAVFSLHYIPFHKFLRISGTSEKEFVKHQQLGSEAPHTLYFDFEVDPKSGNTGNLYKGIAHSGQYSTKTFGKNSYSFAIERKAGDIGLENLDAIAMSAWVYVFPGKNDPLGNLVFTITNGNINVVWKAVTISGNNVPRGKWFKISGRFDLAGIRLKPDYKLQIYFWNNSSTDILEDDFYIVFGGPKPRRGDSTLTNLTGGAAFMPKFNFPPFPFYLFGKEDIGNGNSSFLVNSGGKKEGDISPYDRLFSGHFISDPHGTEDLLVINKAGNLELFTFCRDKQAFCKITPLIASGLLTFFQSADIMTGCFSGDGVSQLLLSCPKGLLLGEFERPRNACSGKTVQVSFKTILNTSDNPFLSGPGHSIAADLEGNKITEILSTGDDGSWKVFRFVKGNKDPWMIMASGKDGLLKQWDPRVNNVKITPGRFLQKYPQDLLLTISRERSKPGYSWSLLRFDPASGSFVSCFSQKQNCLGKTIGLDTLKPSDEFFTGTFDNSGKFKTFRYNRDWRYDLKEIRFNDSTFQIIANMDFTGYENDYNPKYYEILRLFPAMLVIPGMNSLLVIGKNCKTRDPESNECKEFMEITALPGTIGVYSFRKTER
jgi:hypothetical protein